MKPVYSNVIPQRGPHIGGAVKLHLLPKEWLTADPVIDFSTNIVVTPLTLLSGKGFLTLDLVEDTLEYDEVPKSNAAGTYYEIQVSGVLNYIDAELLQLFETWRYHEFVVKTMDRNRQWRIIGNTENGMLFTWGSGQRSENGGTAQTTITLKMEVEKAPPYATVSSSSSS